MTIRHLKVFIAVAQTGKMGAAAKGFISQPTVSQVISEIEGAMQGKAVRTALKSCTSPGRAAALDYARHIIPHSSTRWAEFKLCLHPSRPAGGSHHNGGQLRPALYHPPV